MLTANQADCQTQTRHCPVLVLGVGNILLRDEGLGVRLVQAMESRGLPPGVAFLDGATAGLDLLDALADRRKVIIIDAVEGDAQPGTVYRLTPEDLLPRSGQRVSLHDLGLLETLTVARQLGIHPAEVVIIGVTPRDISCGLELSPEIAGLLPKLIEVVLAEVGQVAGVGQTSSTSARKDGS